MLQRADGEYEINCRQAEDTNWEGSGGGYTFEDGVQGLGYLKTRVFDTWMELYRVGSRTGMKLVKDSEQAVKRIGGLVAP